MTDPIASELVWLGAIMHRTGYAAATRNHLRGLHQLGFPVHVKEMWKNSNFLPSYEDMNWFSEMANRKPAPNSVCVIFHPPSLLPDGSEILEHTRLANPGMGRYIGYTMFETDRIPASWVERLDAMDEIWVPTKFNAQTFVRSGVDPQKLRVIPLGIDTNFFDARRHFPKCDAGANEFRFLSSFEWLPRKGWDVLLRAFWQEFRADEKVSLTLHTYRGLGGNLVGKGSIQEELEAFAKNEFGKSLRDLPTVRIDESRLSDEALPSYYLGHNAYISTSRGEGWGMPMMEAMSLGLPVAAPRWGGQLEFMNEENSYLIDIDGVVPVAGDMVMENAIYAGHRWCEPSVASARSALRRMFSDHEENKRRGQAARQHLVRHFSLEAVAKKVVARVQEIAGAPRVSSKPAAAPDTVGAFDEKELFRVAVRGGSSRSFGHQRVDYEISRILNPESGFLLVEENDSPEFLISHDDPPSLEPPPSGCRWIWFARWPYEGSIPERWIPTLLHRVDEIWTSSEFGREAYLRAGIPESKLRVIPLGVNPNQFHRNAAPLKIEDRSKFRFLAQISLDGRQSFEGLLSAFMEAFCHADDVSLVLKFPPLACNAPNAEGRRLLDRLRECPAFGKVTVIDRELDESEMAGLYAACHAFVAPYSSAFHRTAVLEAMSSGIPVIATQDLGAEEPVQESRAFPVLARSTPWLTPEATVPGESFIRVPYENALAEVMKAVWKSSECVRQRTEQASRYVAEERTWESTLRFIRTRMRSPQSVTSAPAVVVPVSFDAEGGGPAGSLRRAGFRNPGKRLFLATGPFEARFDVAVELHKCLESSPEADAVVFHQREGAVSLWRSGIHHRRLPRQENFRSGAWLLDLIRDASAQGLAIRLEMKAGIRFPSDPGFAAEREAVEALVLAQELRAGGRNEEALQQLDRALRGKPDYAAALAEATELELELGNIAHAKSTAQRLLAAAPGWSRSRHLLGIALLHAGEESEAGLWVYQANQMDPGNPLIVFDLAQLYERAGNPERAFHCYRAAWVQNPKNADALSRCIEILSENPAIPGAVEFLKEFGDRTRHGDFLSALGAKEAAATPQLEAVGAG